MPLLISPGLGGTSAPSPGGGDQSPIVWRPGTPSAANCYDTWAEVMVAINGRESVDIYVDTSFQAYAPAVIPDGTYDMKHSTFKSAFGAYWRPCAGAGSGTIPRVQVDIGYVTILDNLRGIEDNLCLNWGPYGGDDPADPCLTFTSESFLAYDPDTDTDYNPTAFFVIGEGCLVQNQTGTPMIRVVATPATGDQGINLRFHRCQQGYYADYGFRGALIDLQGQSNGTTEYAIAFVTMEDAVPGYGWAVGNGVSEIAYFDLDAGSRPSFIPDFNGFDGKACWSDQAAGVYYDDNLASSQLNVFDVQSAIDALKAGTGGGTVIPIQRLTVTFPGETLAAFGPGISSVDCTGGTCFIELPAAPPTGTSYWVKDLFGLSAANPINVVALGGYMFDGVAAPYVIQINYEARQFVFDGGQWNVL